MMFQRDSKQNIAHYKNALGAIKLPGNPIVKKVDISELMGSCHGSILPKHPSNK